MSKYRNILKAILALLFFLCLLDMPYSFYILVRYAAFIGFALLAYDASKQNYKTAVIIYIAVALLFQPFYKIVLGRFLWNIVNVIIGLGLVLSILTNRDRD